MSHLNQFLSSPEGRANERSQRDVKSVNEKAAGRDGRYWSESSVQLGHHITKNQRRGYFLVALFRDGRLQPQDRRYAVHEEQSSDHAAVMMEAICRAAGIDKDQLSLHSDNGGPMAIIANSKRYKTYMLNLIQIFGSVRDV